MAISKNCIFELQNDNRMTTEAFLLNDNFLRFVFEESTDNASFWSGYLARHPEERKTFENACHQMNELLNLRQLSDDEKEQLLHRIFVAIN